MASQRHFKTLYDKDDYKNNNNNNQPEALKSLYRSPGNKKNPIGPM
jgi:hypothetical protein